MHLDCLRFAKHSGHEISFKDQNAKYRKKEFLEIQKKDPLNIIKKDLLKLGLKEKQIITFENIIKKKYNTVFYKVFKSIKLRKI